MQIYKFTLLYVLFNDAYIINPSNKKNEVHNKYFTFFHFY